jgi:hypothetical protein
MGSVCAKPSAIATLTATWAELEKLPAAISAMRARDSSQLTACSLWTVSSPSCRRSVHWRISYDALVMVDDSHCHWFHGPDGTRHSGALRRRRPDRHLHRHTSARLWVVAAAATSRAARRLSSGCASAHGPTSSPTVFRHFVAACESCACSIILDDNPELRTRLCSRTPGTSAPALSAQASP